ncbi:MAG: phage portal protein family protein [Moraxella sp.]
MAINTNTLITAIDAGLNTQSTDSDTLLAQTGKTRQELLDVIMADDEVISCRDDIHTAILAKSWRIWGEGVDEDTINKLYKMVRKLHEDFASLAILAKWYGYSVGEYLYKQDENGVWLIDRLLNKDGELDKYTPKRDGSLTFKADGNEKPISDEFRQVKILLLTSKATPKNPMGELLAIRAYPAVNLRKRGFAYAGQFIARYAQPYVIGKQGAMSVGMSGHGFFNNALNKFTNTLFGFLNGGAATIGHDDSIEIHQLSGNGEAFASIEKLTNARIQKLFLGRTKTSELNSGSRSAQETEDLVRDDRIKGYLDMTAKAISHAINAVIAVNNINVKHGIWFEYESQSTLDNTLAQTIKTYADMGIITFTKEFFLNKVGLEEQHFKIVQNSQKANEQLSLNHQNIQLSDFNNNQQIKDDIDDNQIITPKLNELLSVLQESDDYADFENKLNKLQFSDTVTKDLSDKLLDSFLKGLSGYKNNQGENRLDDI